MEDNKYGFALNFPKSAGQYIICGDLHIYVAKKPLWFHRKIVKILLGWDWKDE